jgi:beta-glucosidase/6-phospho-beta-glucosidase/beta-galactosidase
MTPKGLRKVLNYIKNHYGNKWDVVITENGYIDDGETTDMRRVVYLAVSVHSFQVVMCIHPIM